MEMKKKIELIEAIENNKMNLYREFEADGNQEEARRCLIESTALSDIILILKDDKYAEKIAEIFAE